MNRKWKIILIISLVMNLSIIYVGYKALEYRSHINYFLDKYTNVVNEFSGRHYFQKENKKLLTQENKGNRVVLFGTQVIANWKIEDSSSTYEFINRGLPHQRLAGYLLRFKPDVIDLNPKYVIIEVSSYNFRPQNFVSEIQDYVSSLVELAQYHNIEPILTTIIPPVENSDAFNDYMIMDSLKLYNDWLKYYADSTDFKYIDFNKVLTDSSGFLKRDYSLGLIDLNSDGYNIITKATFDVLNELSGEGQ